MSKLVTWGDHISYAARIRAAEERAQRLVESYDRQEHLLRAAEERVKAILAYCDSCDEHGGSPSTVTLRALAADQGSAEDSHEAHYGESLSGAGPGSDE